MPIVNNAFVPENDITLRLPDGRQVLLAPKGVPVPLTIAYENGWVKDTVPAQPLETKAPRDYVPLTGQEIFSQDPPPATPTALSLAKEYGVDIGGIVGTGKDGRITKYDVEDAIQKAQDQRDA